MKLQKAILCVLIVSLLVSIAIPLATAKKPPKPPGGEEPPADPAIAYFHQTSGPRPNQLYVMNDDGSNKAVIYEEYFSPWGPFSWSPDGGSITWLGKDSSGFGVWRIDVAVVDSTPQGSNLQQLVGDDDCYLGSSAAWSPLGYEIAFVSGDRTSNNWWIRTVPAGGGPLETIYAGNEIGINIRSLSWNTQGTHIAFIETDINTAERYIKIIERATGDVTHTLVKGQYQLARLDWARQGVDTIVFDDQASAPIYTIDIDTGIVTPITTGNHPCWSPDNSYVAFRTVGKKSTLAKIELATGEITKIGGGTNHMWRRN